MARSLVPSQINSPVYLALQGEIDPFYLDLAALSGQQYNMLYGPTARGGVIHLSDFSVPLAPLDERLAFMGFGKA